MLAGKGRKRLELESALHKALERNELVLHYQPKVDVRSASHGGRGSLDALAAWRPAGATGRLHPPGRGNRPDRADEPGASPKPRARPRMAESSSASMRPSPSTCPTACSSKMTWSRRLNMNACAARRAATVPGAGDHRNRPDEGPARRDAVAAPADQIGVEISIDDFGTGYSSLAYLTSLPISELKIDRSFVRDLGVTPQSSAVVTAIIALARALGLRVIAEGVENQRQMEVLHRLGCHICQGFLFARPMPAAQIATWLNDVLNADGLPRVSESLTLPPVSTLS
jgi:hypothetical protein